MVFGAQKSSLRQFKKQSNRLETYISFNIPIHEYQLDAILSINNYNAGVAAVAEYPALTIPMGYQESGEPINMTFIAKQFQEGKLYALGSAFEALTKARKLPETYMD